MKLSFEGVTIQSIIDQMGVTLNTLKARNKPVAELLRPATQAAASAATPFEVPRVDKPADKPVDKQEAKPPIVGKRERTERQKANDERLRAAALAKIAAKKAAKADMGVGIVPPVRPTPPPPVPEPVAEPEVFADPAEVVRIRQKTIEDLQQAYANGHQQEVFELLSRFGNGAKSFRELPPEAFMPIREAIDKGALT